MKKIQKKLVNHIDGLRDLKKKFLGILDRKQRNKMADLETEDFFKKPQLISVLKNEIVHNKKSISVSIDDLLLDEYRKILSMFDIDFQEPKGYKIVKHSDDYTKDPEIESEISLRICSNCRSEEPITKSVHTPIFVIHLCKYCTQAFDISFGSILDP